MCMCVGCLYICVWGCMYVFGVYSMYSTHVCGDVCMFVGMDVHMCMGCMYVYGMYVHLCVGVYVCVYVCVCVYI